LGARRTGSCWLRALTGLLLASALFVPGALAEPALDARLDSLRQLRLDLSGTPPADESPSWRAAVDADESHDVSAQEVGAFVSLLEAERALREARMGYYKSQVNVIQSLADLERVVGKELQ